MRTGTSSAWFTASPLLRIVPDTEYELIDIWGLTNIFLMGHVYMTCLENMRL